MSVMSVICSERERYAEHFEIIATDIASKSSAYARELLISINHDGLAYPYRYLRADLIEKAEDGSDKLYEVWLEPPRDNEAKRFQLGTVEIEICPFTWCSAQIAFDRSPPDLGKLEAFLTEWLDVADAKAGPTGRANAIHSASQVESNGQLWYLTIDFGTAPADAMLDLIDFLANEVMAQRIVITSHSRA